MDDNERKRRHVIDLALVEMEKRFGKGSVLRAGEDVALVGYGTAVDWCSRAAVLLESSGVSATVVNARFAKPLDEELLLRIVRGHRHVLLVEEHALMGGFGSAVLERCEERGELKAGIHRLGIPDRFVDHAPRPRQLEKLGLTPDHIAELVRGWLGLATPAPDPAAAAGAPPAPVREAAPRG